jgi:hypothetical protein
MELIEQNRRQSAAPGVSIWFPWLAPIALSVLTSITLIVIGVILAAHRETSNPFSTLSGLLGQSARQAALAHGFTCPVVGLHGHNLANYCGYYRHEMFSRIYLRVSGNVVDEIIFSVAENKLTLGELEVLWGRPEIRLSCETVTAAWPAYYAVTFLATPETGDVSRFTPILHIFFTRSGGPRLVETMMHEARLGC